MLGLLRKDRTALAIVIFFLVLSAWWVSIYLRGIQTETENYLFGGVYGGLSLIGGVIGLQISREWGGIKSIMGRAIVVLSLGLLFQAFGQYVFWFYNFFLNVEIPYPSLADVGYFGSIPFYIYGMYLLAKASGVNFIFSKVSHQLQSILIPLLMLSITYWLFINKHELDWSDPLKVLLDLGYPLGQAVYVSVALLTYSLSRGVLGGVMRPIILLLVAAFIVQYLADFTFLFFQNDYYNASFIDYIYMTAYLVMILGLLQLRAVLKKLRE